MQLVCNGVNLDLKRGAALSFKKSNILFAFDKAECERSVSFDLPATPTNEKVLQLAKLPAYSGSGMRRRFTAQLQDGLVTKNGYLHVDSYSGGNYKAVFVTGELIGLQALKEAGSVAEIVDNVGGVRSYTYTGVSYTPTQAKASAYESISYKREQGMVIPSIRYTSILSSVLTALGVRHSLPFDDYIRIIPKEFKPLQERLTTITRTAVGQEEAGDNYPLVNTIAQSTSILSPYLGTGTEEVLPLCVYDDVDYSGTISQLTALQDLLFTFPDDTPSGWHIYSFETGSFTAGRFLDGATVTQFVDGISGAELAGRSIEIPRGTGFCFVHSDEYLDHLDAGGYRRTNGFALRGDISIPCYISAATDAVVNGDIVLVQDNLPDVDTIELLKGYAAMRGRVLNYTDADGLTLDDLDVQSWSVLDVSDKLVTMDSVERTFSDYGQRNVVEFDSGERVLSVERIRRFYTIDNENIEPEVVLQNIPFSEGGRNGVYLYVRGEGGADNIVADAGTTLDDMVRVSLPAVDGLQMLCTRSTSVQVSLRLSLMEWERLTPKTVVQINGMRYVWTSGTWKSGKVSLILNAIP